MEKNYEQSNSIQPIQPFGAPAGVNVMFSIGGTIIGLISGPGSAAVSILGTVVDMLWPDNPTEPNVTWKEMMNYTSELIDQKLKDDTIIKAEGQLNGLKSLLDDYDQALENLLHARKVLGFSSPVTTLSESTLKSLINGVHQSFVQTIPAAFAINGYNTALLPAYANAANLHLLFLRHVLIDKEKLGLDSEDFKRYTNSLSTKTTEYINYCTSTYKNGLSSQKERGWTYFNKYRRDMTLAVLDIISLFPNYDPKNYNPTYDISGKNIESFDFYLYSKPIKTEITREIYSDVINDDVYGVMNVDHDINEKNFIRPPHLFTWLEQLKLVTTRDFSNAGFTFLSGHQNKYSFTPRNISSLYSGEFFGQGTDYPNATESFIDLNNNSSIYNLSAESYKWIYPWYDPVCITKINFSITDQNSSKNLIYGGNVSKEVNKNEFNFSNKEGSGPSTFNNYSHVLSYMQSFDAFNGDRKRKGYIFAFTHSSVDPENIIDTDKITQIPAVKASEIALGAIVFKGPHHLGGDIIELPRRYSQSGPSVTIRFKAELGKKYRIRLHYASIGTPLLCMFDNRSNEKTISLNQTIDNSSNLDKYDSFKCMDTDFIVTGSAPYYSWINLQNYNNATSPNSLYINKVEFIPIA